jgi:hypothetical protein
VNDLFKEETEADERRAGGGGSPSSLRLV